MKSFFGCIVFLMPVLVFADADSRQLSVRAVEAFAKGVAEEQERLKDAENAKFDDRLGTQTLAGDVSLTWRVAQLLQQASVQIKRASIRISEKSFNNNSWGSGKADGKSYSGTQTLANLTFDLEKGGQCTIGIIYNILTRTNGTPSFQVLTIEGVKPFIDYRYSLKGSIFCVDTQGNLVREEAVLKAFESVTDADGRIWLYDSGSNLEKFP